MTATVVFAVRLKKELERRVKVNVELEIKVSQLKQHASNTVDLPAEDLGVALEDGNTLAFYRFKSGRTVHILMKAKSKLPPAPQPVSNGELHKFINTLEEYGYKNILQKFPRKEILKKIVTASPRLQFSLEAVALLLDPEMLVLFSEPEVLQKFLDMHPLVGEALAPIMTYLQENPIIPDANQASTSSGNAYSLEALSDDEAVEHNARRRGAEGHPLTRNASYNAITAAQLSAAIANARNFSSTGAVLNDAGETPPAAPAAPRPIITSEMFGNALQQAFSTTAGASAATATDGSNAPKDDEEESMDGLRRRLQVQLQQMRDMGLVDEAQNLRALQVTNGDVQAAIEMVFGNDIDMNF